MTMKMFSRIANNVYQSIFNPEWIENGAFFVQKPDEAEMIVVGMMFKIKGPSGHYITPDDVADVLKYRDSKVFAHATGGLVSDMYKNMERNKDDLTNPFEKWNLKRQIKEMRKARGYPEKADPEFDAIKWKLQRDLEAAKNL